MKQDRLDQILKFIVEDFIRTSQPVGSQNLIKDHNLSYSSATIRNDMAKLEKEGLIEKDTLPEVGFLPLRDFSTTSIISRMTRWKIQLPLMDSTKSLQWYSETKLSHSKI